MDLLVALIIFLVLLGSVALGALVAAVLWLRGLRRSNRVVPDVPTAAPLTWLATPTSGARLHRRLRAAVLVARASAEAAETAPHLAGIVDELEAEAVALDQHVVIASRLSGSQGRARMRELATQVGRVEQVASQVSTIAAQTQAPIITRGQPAALDDLALQLENLAEARREVIDVEAAAGVTRVSPFADPDREVATARPRLEKAPGTPTPR